MRTWHTAIPLLLLAIVACGKQEQVAQDVSPASASDEVAAPVADVSAISAHAEAGDAQAQYELGLLYAEGNGVAKNALTAAEWFRAAAEQGHAKAQFEMGSAALTGEGARPNIAEAAGWYRKAAVNMPEAAGAADYLDAVHQGTDGAEDQLHQGMWLYEDGDYGAAIEKLQPLADGGNMLATYFAAKIDQGFAEALASEEDPADREMLEASALGSMTKAAEAGFVWAQLDLAEMHLERSWTEGADDPAGAAEARRWYQAAADQGSRAGFEGLALVSAEGIPDAGIERFDGVLEGTPDPSSSETPPAEVVPAISPEAEHAPDGRSDLQICGRMWGEWQWTTGNIPGALTFDMENRVGAAPTAGAPQVLTGTWTCDPATASFTITWTNGVVETYTMASDGSSISGQNNYGSPVRGTPLR